VSGNIIKVTIFAIAFGFAEAAVVVYLRHLLGATQPTVSKDEVLLLLPGIAFLQPQTAIGILKETDLLNIERIREAATIIMLAVIGGLAGRNFLQKAAYFFLAFGIWDIFYYVFLKLTINWPVSLQDLDIFFLLPVPWVGPVFVPLVISIILIITSLGFLLKNKK